MVTKVSDTLIDSPWESHFERIEDGTLGALEFKIGGGVVTDNNNWYEVAESTHTVPNNTTTVYVVNYANGVVSTSTASASSKYLSLYSVTTVAGAITAVTDLRTPLVKKGVFLPTWSDTVATLGPDYWYSFEEASGNIINKGTIATPSNYDFIPKTYSNAFNGTYQVSTITGTGNTGMEFNGGGRLDTNFPWGGSYGTVFMICNIDDCPAGQFNFMGGVSENFDQTQIQFIGITVGTTEHAIRIYKEPAPTGGTPLSHEPTDRIGTWPYQSGWHSFAVRQNNDTNIPELFVDGVNVAVTTYGTTGGPLDYQWFSSIVPARETMWGCRAGVSTSIKAEHIMDELLYFENNAVSDANIKLLHDSAFA